MDKSELCIDDQPAAEPSVSSSTSPVPHLEIMNPSPLVVGWGWPAGPGLSFSLSRRRPRAWPAGGWVGTDYWTSPSPSPSPLCKSRAVRGGTCACACGQGTGRSEARAGQRTQRKDRAHRPVGQGPGAGNTVLVRKLARN